MRALFIVVASVVALVIIWLSLPAVQRDPVEAAVRGWVSDPSVPDLSTPNVTIPDVALPTIPTGAGGSTTTDSATATTLDGTIDPITEPITDPAAGSTPTTAGSDLGIEVRNGALLAQGDYDRDQWKHWVSVPGKPSCWDTQDEVTLRQSLRPVTYVDGSNRVTSNLSKACEISHGLWWSSYDGDAATADADSQLAAAVGAYDAGETIRGPHFWTTPKPSKSGGNDGLDADHVVPLEAAHLALGGQNNWIAAQRQAYANDIDVVLLAVRGGSNRSKGGRMPTTAALKSPGKVVQQAGVSGWVPSNKAYWCDYADKLLDIKRTYSMAASADEAAAYRQMLAAC